jgi:hypothetical protein
MFDTRREFVTALAGAGAMVIARFGRLAAQERPPRQAPDQERKQNEDEVTPEKSQTKALLEANDKDIKKNVEKLYELASDLKAEVEKTDSSKVLSMVLIKKAEEIERLAKDIKTRAKG